MPLSSYCQSLDSLPLKELNNEFLKGISARERLHYIKKIAKLDSIQLSLYKDSIVPKYEAAISKSTKAITELNSTVAEQKTLIKLYRYSCVILALATIGLVIF